MSETDAKTQAIHEALRKQHNFRRAMHAVALQSIQAGDVLLRENVRRHRAFAYGDQWRETVAESMGDIHTGDTTIHVHGVDAGAATDVARAAVSGGDESKNV